MSKDAFSARMQNILHIANRLKEATSASNWPSHPPPRNNHLSSMIDSINVPSPPPLLPSLLEAGAGHEIAVAASKLYELHAEELRNHIQKSIVTAAHKIAELPVVVSVSSPDVLIGKVVSTAAEVYLQRLGQWKEEIVRRIQQSSKSPVDALAPRNSRAFNCEYVPFLEHFFKENPFPTQADKKFLAKKSNMEYRQIHVWFQNRRNRTKKEGKPLRKKPMYEGATKPLDKLYERMKGHIGGSNSLVPEPSKTGASEGSIEIEIARKGVSKDALASSSPPHAFPSSYPPTCHYDPFPCKNGSVQFSKLEWRRASCAKLSFPHSTSMDELVARFSQLNIRDERSQGFPKQQSQSATAALTVIPSCAPHPSLIMRKYQQPTNTIQRYPLVRAPVSSSKIFPDPSHALKPVTLVPLSVPPDKSKLPGRRKTAPLPQRFPGRARNARQDTAPSESPSTSSASPRSCSPNSEGRSPPFSSVNSSPTPPDTRNTRKLTYSFGSPCRSPFDSSIHPGDMVAVTPSPIL